MNCHARLVALVLAVGLFSGCVERRFVITADPPGAVVYCNGEYMGLAGSAPGGGVDKFFTYYGKYRFTIVKDGYVALTTEEMIDTPWYELPPLDFLTENAWPFKVSDVRRLHFKLEKAIPENAQNVLDKSNVLRSANDHIVSPILPPRRGAPGGPGSPGSPAPTLVQPAPALPGQPAPVPPGQPTPAVPGQPLPPPVPAISSLPPAISTSAPATAAPR